jgi:predicted unusual protein kinase regulating ubiquinone biosynthesis (AarF/ABC1/UbiB family)
MLRARYRKIILFFANILVSVLYWDIVLPRIGLGRWARNTRPQRLRKIASRYRTLAVEMGGVLIKVGQFMSARVDVMPPEVTDELADLQDEVPSEPFEAMCNVVESEFGIPILDKYLEFDPEPLAAASLGQAHLALIRITKEQAEQLHALDKSTDINGDISYPVVVKIQRPHIEEIIATDLAAIRTVGGWVRRYRPIQKRVNVPGLIAEFTRTLYEEIDYLAEGKNAEIFAANFSHDPEVLVPKVIWTHTTKRVLTLEDVRGIKITDYEAITAAGIDKAEVASRLLDTYLKQIFEDGFFHADPHPGNLFVKSIQSTDDIQSNQPVKWLLTFIDFGMVGRMKPEIRAGLRELLIGVGIQDASRVVKAYQILGILLPGADVDLLERAESAMFQRFWGKGMDELRNISMDEIHEFAYEFREILFNMPFQLPQDLIFLGRAVGILSGMCTGLDPQINVFAHLGPFSQKIISEEAQHDWSYWVGEAGSIARKVLSLPLRADALITKLERGELSIRDPKLSESVAKLEKTASKAVAGIIFAAFLVASIQLSIVNQELLSWLFRVATLGTFLWIIFK